MKGLALRFIGFYQLFVSPLIPPSCRFQPTCSRYGFEAISRYGLARGGWLTTKRLARCHPLSKGGVDPVP